MYNALGKYENAEELRAAMSAPDAWGVPDEESPDDLLKLGELSMYGCV